MSPSKSNVFRLPAQVWTSTMLALSLSVAMPAFAQEQAPPSPPQDPQPEHEPDASPDAQTSASNAALQSELASARRFDKEIADLLEPDGQLDPRLGQDATAQLVSLATRCGILANSAIHDEVRMLLLGYQARAVAAMLPHEQAKPTPDFNPRNQLIIIAEQIRALALPGAEATADYWLLMTELAQHADAKLALTQRQALCETALTTFIATHQNDEHATEYLIDTRLSLAKLMDQRGAQREVVKQLNLIGKLPGDSPRLRDIKQLRDSVARLGKPIEVESISTQLTTWRSADHLGKPVLIHIYADSVEPSVRMIDVISRSIVQGNLSGVAVVSLRVGEPVATSTAPPWPTLPVPLQPDGILDQLGITDLPTLAWLDPQGRLASIGNNASVLNQLDSLKPLDPELIGDVNLYPPEP